MEGGHLRADKTRRVHELINLGRNLNFSHWPKMFGKTLFPGALEEFFSGRRELSKDPRTGGTGLGCPKRRPAGLSFSADASATEELKGNIPGGPRKIAGDNDPDHTCPRKKIEESCQLSMFLLCLAKNALHNYRL
ncbi:MAG: hypothetical protein LBP95_08555 [Deltaproteobacteria bacterium]|jgi:hypothetical protein|nr:hypothetical protein [Deltaproteobacteria bacterium]